MLWRENLYPNSSDSPKDNQTDDAVFIGWQQNYTGEAFPLYTITAQHPCHGSTVSDKTLQVMNLKIPQTPPNQDK